MLTEFFLYLSGNIIDKLTESEITYKKTVKDTY